MKLVISVTEKSVDAPFDARFGRATAFCVVDTESDERTVRENPALSAAGGAGVQAAQFVAKLGAQAVVSGAFGPHAFSTLEAAKVGMYLAPTSGSETVTGILARFAAGELRQAAGAASDGHHDGEHGPG